MGYINWCFTYLLTITNASERSSPTYPLLLLNKEQKPAFARFWRSDTWNSGKQTIRTVCPDEDSNIDDIQERRNKMSPKDSHSITVFTFYASAQRNVAGGILYCTVFLSCSSVRASVRPCVRPETLLILYLAEYLTHFHQTYTTGALWDRDECFKIWGQKIKGQGHGGIVCWKQQFLVWAC